MTERERMLAGELYNAGDPELTAARDRAKQLCWRYSQMDPTDYGGRTRLLQELLGGLGDDSWIEPPFRCDYGAQISLGEHAFVNCGCVFLDQAAIVIGNYAQIAPGVCLYTVGHPLDPEARDTGLEFGRPITIQDSVWLGGNVVVLPGVTIGEGTVVAAGSVVTRDLPPRVLAAGNPCRVLRPLTERDRAHWAAQVRAYQAGER